MVTETIKHQEMIQAWLADNPLEWPEVVIARAALRTIPISALESNAQIVRTALPIFRLGLLSWALRSRPTVDYLVSALTRAEKAAENIPIFLTDVREIVAAIGRTPAGSQRKEVARILFDLDATLDWYGIQADHVWLSDYHGETPERVLNRRPVWLQNEPDSWRRNWNEVVDILISIHPSYAVWIDWYERRIRGERAAFDIPGDRGRKEDKAILRKLAEATDEDFWGKGATYVNTTLQGWIDEGRARCAPPPLIEQDDQPERLTPDDIAELLQQQASPQAQIVDGKLDAVPNTVFDKPQYGDNLADLPSELLAYTNTILKSLPRNCPDIVRHCFEEFGNEMLVRGNRPILNILKGMTASIRVEVYVSHSDDASPDEWQLRDPREWGPGMGAMFAHFFKGYLDLINHFPRDEEREELIANTPIDEVAASGLALTEPVDAVVAEVDKLGETGRATDNFVRIVDAMGRYNQSISQLPQSGQPSTVVTPKRRHILNTIGFFVSLLGVIGSAASIYSIGAEGMLGLISALKAAVEQLLSFIL